MAACIFCPNPRTRKRGEHLWDDWLNREDGKEVRKPSTTTVRGMGGTLIREYPTDRIEVTLPVVCDSCNNTWMSDLSSRAKTILQDCIRRDQLKRFDALDIVTMTALFFLKSAVLDWSSASLTRRPLISRANCVAFRESLVLAPDGEIAFPLGLQIWIARYQRTRAMEAQASTDELTGRGAFRGYTILLITYVIGSFIFQLTFPRWTKRTRNRKPPPFFQIVGDVRSIPIWPGVTAADWPPLEHISGGSLEDFRERFRRVLIPSAR